MALHLKFVVLTLFALYVTQHAEATGGLKVRKFYIHDNLNLDDPKNSSVIIVANSPSFTGFLEFGHVLVFEDRVTEGPDYNSKYLGVSQGIYVSSSLPNPVIPWDIVFFTTFTIHFSDGTLSLHGRDAFLQEEIREFPIIGGTGAYRFISGYTLFKTHAVIPPFYSIMEVEMYYKLPPKELTATATVA